MKTLPPPQAAALALLIALLFASPAQAAAWKVLFYGPLHHPDGVAAAFVNSDPRFAPVGQGSAVWSAQTWFTKAVANAISANGLIAGQSRLKVGASQVWRAFVLSNAGNPGTQPLVNLNDVTWMWVNNQWVLATSQGWTLVSAERINRAGWIVGYGTKGGQARAFVLSPR